jgi:predicted amidohydrolase
VNRVGEQDGLPFSGGSVALDPDARMLAAAGSEGERVVGAEVGGPGRRDSRTRYRELLRDELYEGGGR